MTVHFAASYTDYEISPWARGAAPGAAGFNLALTLSAAQELDMTGQVDAVQLSTLIERALNEHAGGLRHFGETPVDVRWRLRWGRSSVRTGRALGVSVLDDEVLDTVVSHRGESPSAMCIVCIGHERSFARILLRSAMFSAGTARSEREAAPRRRAVIGHELGHGLGLDDSLDPTSTMLFRELSATERRRIDQHWSDGDLRTALGNVFDGPGRVRPDWL